MSALCLSGCVRVLCVCICACLHAYVCLFVCACVLVHVRGIACWCAHVYARECMCVCVWVYGRVKMYECFVLCVRVCACVCLCVYVYVLACVFLFFLHGCVWMFMCVDLCIYISHCRRRKAFPVPAAVGRVRADRGRDATRRSPADEPVDRRLSGRSRRSTVGRGSRVSAPRPGRRDCATRCRVDASRPSTRRRRRRQQDRSASCSRSSRSLLTCTSQR